MLKQTIKSVAALVFGLIVGSAANAQRVGWRVVEVYSSADASSQFVQLCGGLNDQQLGGQALFASNGSTTHSLVFPSNLPGDSACFLVGTQGLADLNLVKPDYVVPNGFLFVPDGSVSLASFDTVKYAGLPTDGLNAIATDTDERPINGDPSTYVRQATATNFAGASYAFGAAQGGPPFVIGPGITGAWYDPSQSGHGLFIEVLPGSRFYASWFAFDPAGSQQAWFTGVGTYNGSTASIAVVEMPTGGRWIPNFDPSQIARKAWGSLTFAFTDCNHGKVDFNSVLGYGTGSMNLTRLTQVAGLTCP